jgi:hypothetical protein
MPIEPDTKDWTWVLERRCGECGFEASSFDRAETGTLVRAVAAQWVDFLRDPPPSLTERPDDSTWSPLEYAGHVRDVFALYDERLRLMLTEDDPHYENWDQDVAAVEQRYDEQDPAEVATAIERDAARVADRFDSVAGDQWSRTGNRSDGARFTVETFARYFIHDPIHHLWDVDRPFV